MPDYCTRTESSVSKEIGKNEFFLLLQLLGIYTRSITVNTVLGTENRRNQTRSVGRRALLLLTSLVVIFGLSWLPWNLYNTLTTFGVIEFSLTTGFPFCHLIGQWRSQGGGGL